MANDAVHRELNFLGIDRATAEALALLPLVQVAWADGEVQEQEREAILAIATEQFHIGEDGAHLLDGWLQHPPSPAYLERGRRLLVALAHEREDFDLAPEHLEDVVSFSKHVAMAAGGFFGFRSVSAEEAEAIEAIAQALSVSHAQPVGLTEHDEDIEDEDTEVRDPEAMAALRGGMVSPEPRTLPGMAIACLVSVGTGDGLRYEMDGAGLSIGRSSAASVQIREDGEVSRLHCKLYTRDGRFYVEDNQTTNGTFVNGERIATRRLFGGEQIAVGGAKFGFRVEADGVDVG